MTILTDTITSFDTSYPHNTYQDTGLSLTIPSGEGGDWIILFGCNGPTDPNQTGGGGYLQILHESTQLCEFRGGVGTGYTNQKHPTNFAGVRTCSQNDVIKVQIKCGNIDNPASIEEDAFLVLMTLPSGAQTDSDYLGSQQSYNTDTNWYDVSNITITPSGTQDLIVFGHIDLEASDNDPSGHPVKARLYDSTHDVAIQPAVMVTLRSRCLTFAQVVNTSSATTFKIQVACTDTSYPVLYQNSFIVGFTDSDVDDFNYDYLASDSTSSSSLNDAASLTWTPDTATDYIIIFFGNLYNNGTAWYDGPKWECEYDSTGVFGSAIPLLAAWDDWYFTGFLPMSGSLTASSRTDTIQFAINSGGTSYCYDSVVLAFREITGAAVSKTLDLDAYIKKIDNLKTLDLDSYIQSLDNLMTLDLDAILQSLTSGTVCWGHDTGVDETNIRDFSGNWSGTGAISGSGDSEVITLDATEYMESEIVEIVGQMIINLDTYASGSGPAATIEYKTGDSEANCEADTYHSYSGSFLSDGYVKIKVSRS